MRKHDVVDIIKNIVAMVDIPWLLTLIVTFSLIMTFSYLGYAGVIVGSVFFFLSLAVIIEYGVHKKERNGRKYKVVISYPKLLSKGYDSLFIVQIYLPLLHLQAETVRSKELPKSEAVKHSTEIELEEGVRVRICLSSHVLSFSDPVVKQIKGGLVTARFTAIPTNDCRPGDQVVLLSIVDVETQIEYLSTSFTVQVVDFAFDHISRPSLSKAIAAVSWAVSSFMFVLTALEQVDKTFGLRAGTAAAVLAGAISLLWWHNFHRLGVKHPL